MTSASRERIAERAQAIAAGPDAWTDQANWLRAERELWIEDRARAIAASDRGGSERDNWLRAERELWITIRAEKIARSSSAGTEFENWLRAEKEVHEIVAGVYDLMGLRAGGQSTMSWDERYTRGKRISQKPDHVISSRARELGIERQDDGRIRAWIDLIVKGEVHGP